MPKERSVNPAQAQRKADKQKEINRNRKQVQAQRNEKLARRNPERLQKQIDELKDLESRGVLRPKDKDVLAELEKDVRGIRRAREALGDAAPNFSGHDRKERTNVRQEQRDRRQHLGKRQRDDADEGSDTDPEVRAIPMPRDTPPPIPRQPFHDAQVGPDGQRVPHALPSKPAPPPPVQTVYSSAPQLRDLKKEALKFMPSVVSQHKSRAKGQGRLLEPEEMDSLEQAGYMAAEKASLDAGKEAGYADKIRTERLDELELEAEAKKLEAELREIDEDKGKAGSRTVQMEEVEDDGG